MHHIDHDVAVANTGLDILLTTIAGAAGSTSGCTAIRLSAEQARAIGWALVEAAGHLEEC